MNEYSTQQTWIANGLTATLVLLGAIIATYSMSSDMKTHAFVVLVAVVGVLFCFYFWQNNRLGKSSGLFLTIFGVVWTFISLGIYALIHHVSYFDLLSFQSAVLGPDWVAVGPFLTMIGLVTLLRSTILWLLSALGIVILRLLNARKRDIPEK